MSADVGVLLLRNIKKPLRGMFKIATVKHGTNMTEAVREFMAAYVKSDGKIMEHIRRVR
jgi:plasmid stability protein